MRAKKQEQTVVTDKVSLTKSMGLCVAAFAAAFLVLYFITVFCGNFGQKKTSLDEAYSFSQTDEAYSDEIGLTTRQTVHYRFHMERLDGDEKSSITLIILSDGEEIARCTDYLTYFTGSTDMDIEVKIGGSSLKYSGSSYIGETERFVREINAFSSGEKTKFEELSDNAVLVITGENISITDITVTYKNHTFLSGVIWVVGGALILVLGWFLMGMLLSMPKELTGEIEKLFGKKVISPLMGALTVLGVLLAVLLWAWKFCPTMFAFVNDAILIPFGGFGLKVEYLISDDVGYWLGLAICLLLVVNVLYAASDRAKGSSGRGRLFLLLALLFCGICRIGFWFIAIELLLSLRRRVFMLVVYIGVLVFLIVCNRAGRSASPSSDKEDVASDPLYGYGFLVSRDGEQYYNPIDGKWHKIE